MQRTNGLGADGAPMRCFVQAASEKHSIPVDGLWAATELIRSHDEHRSSAKVTGAGAGYVHELRHRGIAIRIRRRTETIGTRCHVFYTLSSPRLGLDAENDNESLHDAIASCVAAAGEAGLLRTPADEEGPLL